MHTRLVCAGSGKSRIQNTHALNKCCLLLPKYSSLNQKQICWPARPQAKSPPLLFSFYTSVLHMFTSAVQYRDGRERCADCS